jgi:hypothetical protein
MLKPEPESRGCASGTKGGSAPGVPEELVLEMTEAF